MQLQNAKQSRNESQLSDLEAFDRLIEFRYVFDRDVLVQDSYQPTKFSLATGENAVVDDILSYQQYNRLKNHWPDINDPDDVVAGMTWYKSDTQRYYFYDGTAAEQVELWSKSSKIALTNLLTNSGIGVWSQSDTNKGIGAMTYDSGSVAPVVGELLTDDVSSAVGKVISYTLDSGTFGGGNAAGVIQLGACNGRFADNNTVSGSAGGANILTVNMPDNAPGVDLIQNGEFESSVDGWTPSDCTLASIAGGQVGNCLELTRTGGVEQFTNQDTVTETGKLYKLSVYVKSGTSGNEAAAIQVFGTALGTIIKTLTSTGGWVEHAIVFEALETATSVFLIKTTATVGTMLFDSVSLYEITPGYTGGTNAFDGWAKDGTLDIYRQHDDGGTLTKDGSFYSLKMVPTVVNDHVYFPKDIYNKVEWLQRFAGKTITFGLWAITNTASNFRFSIYDDGDNYSDYHTGGGAWEWIETTITIGAAVADFRVFFYSDAAPAVNGDTIVYISQPMLIFGSAIGAGNYSQPMGEIIWLEKNISSNLLDHLGGQTDTGATLVNLEADSNAKLPKGAKAFNVVSNCKDSGSAGETVCFFLLQTNASGYRYFNSIAGLANDAQNYFHGRQDCISSGDYYYRVAASGGDTFDFGEVEYTAVRVS